MVKSPGENQGFFFDPLGEFQENILIFILKNQYQPHIHGHSQKLR